VKEESGERERKSPRSDLRKPVRGRKEKYELSLKIGKTSVSLGIKRKRPRRGR